MLGQVWLKVLNLIKMQFCQFLHDKKAGLELTLQTDGVHICVTLLHLYVRSLLLFRLESESFQSRYWQM